MSCKQASCRIYRRYTEDIYTTIYYLYYIYTTASIDNKFTKYSLKI